MLGLAEIADRAVRTYSGGQRRRLEVALGIMHQPRVLFLDEPTTGLDPRSRANLWSLLRSLRDGGTTVFLTTHYLGEADQLSDRVAIVNHGQVIALASPDQLKRRYSGDTISLTPDVAPAALAAVARELADAVAARSSMIERGTIRLAVTDPAAAMATAFGLLAGGGVGVLDASVNRPSLDDVFLRETGRSLRDAGVPGTGAHAADAATPTEVTA